MAVITPVSPGASITPAAASGGGDTVAVASAQRCVLHVINGSGSSINVTVADTQGCSRGVTHNLVTACAANKTTPISIPSYAVDSSGNTAVTYSAVTTVTVYAVSN